MYIVSNVAISEEREEKDMMKEREGEGKDSVGRGDSSHSPL